MRKKSLKAGLKRTQSSKQSLLGVLCVAFGLFICLSFVTPSMSIAQLPKPIVLTFASYIGQIAPQSQVMEWWASEVQRRTNGRVTTRFFYGEALLKATDLLPGIAAGRADFGYIAEAYYPTQLPLTTVVELPFTTSNAVAQMMALNELYSKNESFRKEWDGNGVNVLTFLPLSGNILGMRNPISGIEDLKGKKIRGLGFVNHALRAIGANPVAIAAPEIYESLQRGLLDGYSGFAFEVVTALKLNEVAKNIYDTGLGMYVTPVIIMSKSTWEGLPPEIKQVIQEVNKELPSKASELLMKREGEVCSEILSTGGKVRVLPKEEVEKWKKAVGNEIRDTWVKDLEKKGIKAQDFLSAYVELVRKYESTSNYVPGVATCAQRSE
jgi:TRAP-type transport system periplasmic protein